jgi:hypothetical protein
MGRVNRLSKKAFDRLTLEHSKSRVRAEHLTVSFISGDFITLQGA